MAFEEKTARLSCGDIPYHVGGEGPPVLYFHSAGGVRITRGLELLARDFRVHVPVLPGFDGTAELDSLKTMQDLAAMGADFIDSVIGQSCDVVGQSFGGWVAPWLAVLFPDKVGQLVLECPAGFRPEDSPPPSRDPDILLRQMYAYPEKRPPETKSDAVLSKNREMLHHYHGPVARDHDLVARLGEIEALTLIVLGTKDGRIGSDSVQLLKREIPRSHLIYIYDAAHNIEVDQPERFAGVVGDFLKRAEAFIVNWGDGDANGERAGV